MIARGAGGAPPLRIGILGAARIAPMALVAPARRVAEAEVVAIAARDPAKARAFAARHGIARVHESYDALLADPALDAVYNPLPNGLHCEWTIRALRAGKHVLCEKPMASNAEEAARMAAAARETGFKLVEAFHWRYHPLAARMKAILASGAIGRPLRYEAWFAIPLVMRGYVRGAPLAASSAAKRTWLNAQSAMNPKAPTRCQRACTEKNGYTIWSLLAVARSIPTRKSATTSWRSGIASAGICRRRA
jgi:predicted dehydrogenase